MQMMSLKPGRKSFIYHQCRLCGVQSSSKHNAKLPKSEQKNLFSKDKREVKAQIMESQKKKNVPPPLSPILCV